MKRINKKTIWLTLALVTVAILWLKWDKLVL